MHQKFVDGIWSSVLALSVGTITSLMIPSTKTGILVGFTVGATTGVSVVRVRTIIEQQNEKIKHLEQNLNQITVQLSSQEWLDSVKGELEEIVGQLEEIKPSSAPIESLASTQDNYQLLTPLVPENVPQQVIDWLTQQGITIKTYKKSQEKDSIFNEVALILGNKYHNVITFYEQIKRNLSSGSSFRVTLKSKSQQEISDSTYLGYKLKNYTFLTNYRYDKSNKIIYATPQTIGQFNNFFTGEWFERFVFLKILTLLSQTSKEYQCLINPQIVLPNGDDFELDLFFLIDKIPLWIECKTGDFQAHIVKYAETRKILNVPPDRAFIVVLNISEHQASDVSKLHGIRVLNQDNFLDVIAQILNIEINTKIPTITPHYGQNEKQLISILNKFQLRPLAEYRQNVISNLIDVAKTQNLPKNLFEVKALVFENLQTLSGNQDFSKTKLQDIFNALLRGRCFLNEEDQPIFSMKQMMYSLTSENEEELEKRCLESYAYVFLSVDLNYFESPENVLLFEKTVMGKVPDRETLQEIKDRISQQRDNGEEEDIE